MDLLTQAFVNMSGPVVYSALWILGILVLLAVSAVLGWHAWRLRERQDGMPLVLAGFATLPVIASVYIVLYQGLVWGGVLVTLWLLAVASSMIADLQPRRRSRH